MVFPSGFVMVIPWQNHAVTMAAAWFGMVWDGFSQIPIA